MREFEDRLERLEREGCADGLTCSIGSIVSAAGGVVSGIMGAGAASDAAAAQEKAAGNAQQTLNNANSAVQQGYQPYTATGSAALSALNGDLSNGTGFAQPFNMSQFYSDPGYQFALQQGQNAVNASAAARGGALSGGTIKALTNYTTGLANQTYGDAYNRYLLQSQLRYNQLSGLAGLGLSAANGAASANLSTAKGVAGSQEDAGNAEAAGIIGRQNAINGIFQSVGNAANQYSLNNSTSKNPMSLFGQVL